MNLAKIQDGRQIQDGGWIFWVESTIFFRLPNMYLHAKIQTCCQKCNSFNAYCLHYPYVPILALLVEAVSVRKQVMSYSSGTKSDSLVMGRYWVNKNICSIQPKIFSHHLWFWRPSWIFHYFGLKMVISISKNGNVAIQYLFF